MASTTKRTEINSNNISSLINEDSHYYVVDCYNGTYHIIEKIKGIKLYGSGNFGSIVSIKMMVKNSNNKIFLYDGKLTNHQMSKWWHKEIVYRYRIRSR